MRAKNNKHELELYAVAGTHTVVLSLDMKHKPSGLLGFAYERKDNKTGKRIWLYGQKCFRSIIKDPVPGQQYPTHLHPVQSFMWKDFSVEPGRGYEYKVTPVYGTPLKPVYGDSETIRIRTEPYIRGKHGVYFNRGVSGSQSYFERFGNRRPDQMNEDDRKLAYAWLSRGLFEGLMKFINDAKKGQKLRGAFYEFHFRDVLLALKAAADRGVDVAIITSGKNYKQENQDAIALTEIGNLCSHVRDKGVNEPHNKFLVLLNSNGKPEKVWTGSTNISEKAMFGQCNTGHLVLDKGIAEKYYAYWKELSGNPPKKDLSGKTESLQPDVESDKIRDGITVFFSPRKSLAMLQEYADLINGASEMVCCVYPFNIDKRFQAVFREDEPFIRYILLDTRRDYNTFQTDDRDVEVTAASYIKTAVDQWVKEMSSDSIVHRGIYVHNKIILIDPLSASPVVITGSANYSENSTLNNDENTLIIKSDTRTADIYFTEYVRLFDHFSFREWINEHKNDFKPYLDEKGKWTDKHFDNAEYLSVKRKMVFKNMFVK